MYNQATTKEQPMAKNKEEQRRFCNVALLPEDHERLKELADGEQRTMTRQLSVIIRKEYEKQTGSVSV